MATISLSDSRRISQGSATSFDIGEEHTLVAGFVLETLSVLGAKHKLAALGNGGSFPKLAGSRPILQTKYTKTSFYRS